MKSMLILFFARCEISHHEFFRPTPEARGINGKRYLAILKRLRARIAHVRPEMFEEDDWVLHQDNAPSHNCTLVNEWLAINRTIVMRHCAWSPNLAPNDFWAFSRVKKDMKDKHWGMVEEIERATTNSLKALTVEEFQDCFQQ